jgi:hypothetical protein
MNDAVSCNNALARLTSMARKFGNVEGSLTLDGTKDGIVVAVFDGKTRPSSEPSSILKLKTEPPAELLPEGTGHHQNLRNRLSTHHSSQRFLLSFVGATGLSFDWKIDAGDSVGG